MGNKGWAGLLGEHWMLQRVHASKSVQFVLQNVHPARACARRMRCLGNTLCAKACNQQSKVQCSLHLIFHCGCCTAPVISSSEKFPDTVASSWWRGWNTSKINDRLLFMLPQMTDSYFIPWYQEALIKKPDLSPPDLWFHGRGRRLFMKLARKSEFSFSFY